MGDPSHPGWGRRLDRAREGLTQGHLPALVVSTPLNITYLCGFRGSSGLLVLTPDRTILIVDGRYASAARAGSLAGGLFPIEVYAVSDTYPRALATVLADTGVAAAGFEAAQVTVATLGVWQAAAPGVTFRATEGQIERLRAIKDDHEIVILRRAGKLLSQVATGLRSWVRAGRREREVAADINGALERAGFSEPAFPTIVASGPNSAHPHARPTDRRLEAGDLVVLDFGGLLDGYCGDLTRMFGIGQVSPTAWSLYEAVREAHAAALRAIRDGVEAASVDAEARRVLTACGFGGGILHATGHGLGLEVHEAPRLGPAQPGRTERLQAGMVCTIEPGAYVEGLGGVRLEDDVLVTNEGCEVLTEASRDLFIV